MISPPPPEVATSGDNSSPFYRVGHTLKRDTEKTVPVRLGHITPLNKSSLTLLSINFYDPQVFLSILGASVHTPTPRPLYICAQFGHARLGISMPPVICTLP